MKLVILHFIAKRLRLRAIGTPEGDYLRRHAAKGFLGGWMPGDGPREVSAYLHHFLRPDGDRELHNHPWKWAVSVVLAGGYTEERFAYPELADTDKGMSMVVKRRLRFLSINFLRGADYHRVAELHGKETWTLFIAGPKRTSWGFWVPGEGHVEWREFLTRKGLPIDY